MREWYLFFILGKVWELALFFLKYFIQFIQWSHLALEFSVLRCFWLLIQSLYSLLACTDFMGKIKSGKRRASLVTQMVNNLPAMRKAWAWSKFSLGRFYTFRNLSLSSRLSNLLMCNCSQWSHNPLYFCCFSYSISFCTFYIFI